MQKGTTLIESLIYIAIASILLALAAPELKAWREREIVLSISRSLQQDLTYARYLAASRAQRIIVRPAENGCWSCGWLIAEWPEGRVLQQRGPDYRIAISANTPWLNGAIYQADGSASQIRGGFAAGTLRICSAGAGTSTEVIISRSGRARIRQRESGC